MARKKSSISTLFKFLYRNEQVDKNITDGFNPIKLPKPQPDAIKRLDIDEVVSHKANRISCGADIGV